MTAEQKRIEQLERALKVLHTWASVDGALVPQHVLDITERALMIGSAAEKKKQEQTK